MVEISKIKDRNSLKAWLNALPQDTEAEQAEARRIAVTLAFRSAARVLPVWWEYTLTSDVAREGNVTAKPVLRSLLISYVGVLVPTEDIAAAASATVFSAVASSFADSGDAAAAASSAFSSAVAAVDAVAADAVDAAAGAADAAAKDVWTSIRADAKALTDPASSGIGRLWKDASPLNETWGSVQATLQKTGQTESWGFWIDWYARLLNGTAPPADSPMMVEIALLPDEVWEDVSEANRQINEIWQRHKREQHSADVAKSQRAPEKAAQTTATPVALASVRRQIGAHHRELPATIDALRSMILLEMDYWQTNNRMNAKEPELCKRQLATYLGMFEALEGIAINLPVDGAASDNEAEQVLSLGTVFKNKFLSLPQEKMDDIVQGVWSTGENSMKLGLIMGSTALMAQIGIPMTYGVAASTFVFGGKKKDEILSAAKNALKTDAA